jgi:hypothetical protein
MAFAFLPNFIEIIPSLRMLMGGLKSSPTILLLKNKDLVPYTAEMSAAVRALIDGVELDDE